MKGICLPGIWGEAGSKRIFKARESVAALCVDIRFVHAILCARAPYLHTSSSQTSTSYGTTTNQTANPDLSKSACIRTYLSESVCIRTHRDAWCLICVVAMLSYLLPKEHADAVQTGLTFRSNPTLGKTVRARCKNVLRDCHLGRRIHSAPRWNRAE